MEILANVILGGLRSYFSLYHICKELNCSFVNLLKSSKYFQTHSKYHYEKSGKLNELVSKMNSTCSGKM